MQKWEYLEVYLEYEKSSPRPRLVNGRELPDWKKSPSYIEYFNGLGAQGWELIGWEGTSIFRFKRPSE